MHLFDFSKLCAFKCVLKSPAWNDAYSHWLHMLLFSPLIMCLSIALRITKGELQKVSGRILLNLTSIWKFQFCLVKNCPKSSHIPICYLSIVAILWAKNLLRALAKLEIWHTSKLGPAQKKPPYNFLPGALFIVKMGFRIETILPSIWDISALKKSFMSILCYQKAL